MKWSSEFSVGRKETIDRRNRMKRSSKQKWPIAWNWCTQNALFYIRIVDRNNPSECSIFRLVKVQKWKRNRKEQKSFIKSSMRHQLCLPLISPATHASASYRNVCIRSRIHASAHDITVASRNFECTVTPDRKGSFIKDLTARFISRLERIRHLIFLISFSTIFYRI